MAKLKSRDIEALEIGPIAAQVKRSTSKAQWKRLVKRAHDQGFSINSYLDSSTPRAMKERTTTSLRQQAADTMSAAYAPYEQELSNREASIKSIDEKRRIDNERFGQWLTQRHAELQQNAQNASAAVVARQTAIQAEMQANAQQLQAGMNAYANPTGQVSDPSQFGGNADIANAAALNQQKMGASRELTSQMIGSNEQHANDAAANNLAFMAAQDAKRVSDTWKALSDVADEKQKTQLSKAADSAKEISRLLDQELTKSQMRSDQSIAASSLGVKQDQLALNVSEAGEKKRHNKATESETKRANDIRFGQDAQRLELQWYNARHPKGSSKNTTGTSKGAAQERFEQAYASLASSSRGKAGKPPSHAYVNSNRATVESMLVAKFKLTREMAKRVVSAYLQKNGADPGSYTRYSNDAQYQAGH